MTTTQILVLSFALSFAAFCLGWIIAAIIGRRTLTRELREQQNIHLHTLAENEKRQVREIQQLIEDRKVPEIKNQFDLTRPPHSNQIDVTRAPVNKLIANPTPSHAGKRSTQNPSTSRRSSDPSTDSVLPMVAAAGWYDSSSSSSDSSSSSSSSDGGSCGGGE